MGDKEQVQEKGGGCGSGNGYERTEMGNSLFVYPRAEEGMYEREKSYVGLTDLFGGFLSTSFLLR